MSRPQNLTTRIVQELGVAIVSGVYSAEKEFPIEAALCEQFGASRSVLREAVKMLTAKGLLSARPRQGTKVEPEENWNLFDPDVLEWLLERRFSLRLLRDFSAVRVAMEPTSAWLAASHASTKQIAAIKKAAARMRDAAEGRDDPLLSDIAFHVAVLQASGNRFLAQLSRLVEVALRISIRFTNRHQGVDFASVSQHEKVLDAIAARDPEAAKNAMAELVGEAHSIIASALAAESRGK